MLDYLSLPSSMDFGAFVDCPLWEMNNILSQITDGYNYDGSVAW